MIIVNFKTYANTLGDKGLDLAQRLSQSVQDTKLVLATGSCELSRIAHSVLCPVYAQHVDPITPGTHTGFLSPEHIDANGGTGSLINHAEHQLTPETIQHTIQRCKEAGLSTVVCVPDVATLARVVAHKPDYIAYEPPELIGGDIAVTSANPDVIKRAVTAAGSIPLLCGAGVKTGEDVRVARSLGCVGVLVASGVICASHPEQALKELAAGL